MKQFSHPLDWTAHPAVRALVLAWVAVLSQTPDAALAWGLCLAAALIASRWVLPQAATQAPAAELPALPSAPATPPTRRRTDGHPQVAKLRHPPAPAENSPGAQAAVLKTHRDALTGLASHEYLHDLGEELLQSLRSRGLSLCVLRVGLDGFGPVTERYGHAAGEQVLVQVAKRLRHLARQDDTVVKLDGDEFALLLSCAPHEGPAFSRSLATRVIADLQRPLAYRTVSNLHIGCSVGSAVWPEHGGTLDEVMHHAEEALAGARCSGSGQARQYAGVDHAAAA